MSSTTLDHIAKRLKGDVSAAEAQECSAALQVRRREIAERLAQIEQALIIARREIDLPRTAELDREYDALTDERVVLAHLERVALARLEAALDREIPAAARAALRRLPKLTERLEAAARTHAEARRELDDALTSIGVARARLPAGERDQLVVDDELFTRIAELMHPESGRPGDTSHEGARRALRQRVCAPRPPTYSDPQPDAVELARSPFV